MRGSVCGTTSRSTAACGSGSLALDFSRINTYQLSPGQTHRTRVLAWEKGCPGYLLLFLESSGITTAFDRGAQPCPQDCEYERSSTGTVPDLHCCNLLCQRVVLIINRLLSVLVQYIMRYVTFTVIALRRSSIFMVHYRLRSLVNIVL